jgi:hypothetical protein
MFGPPSGTGNPWSVVPSAVKAWLGTWQVPQDWRPEADKLLSKKMALPATAASETGGAAVLEVPSPPPHPASAAMASARLSVQLHRITFFDVIRIHPATANCRANTIANAIENYSYLQTTWCWARAAQHHVRLARPVGTC